MAEETPKPELSAALTDARLTAAEKAAAFLTKARLDEYIDLLNRPGRLIWLNFISGVARGVGMVVGGGIIATLLILVAVKVLSSMLHHVGGLPWIGDQLEQAIAWVLDVIDQHRGG